MGNSWESLLLYHTAYLSHWKGNHLSHFLHVKLNISLPYVFQHLYSVISFAFHLYLNLVAFCYSPQTILPLVCSLFFLLMYTPIHILSKYFTRLEFPEMHALPSLILNPSRSTFPDILSFNKHTASPHSYCSQDCTTHTLHIELGCNSLSCN